jgi:hypothetical protein
MSDAIELLVIWAWERHHNVLSWYVRPLFLLPYCWFAYRRSATGITVTLVALITSMGWFPAPRTPNPAVVRMLAVEREYLLGAWTASKVALAAVVPLTFVALAAALWRRSVGWALVVVNAAVGIKIAWTFAVDDAGAGALAHLPAALAGLAVVDLALAWWWSRRRPARPSGGRPSGLRLPSAGHEHATADARPGQQ